MFRLPKLPYETSKFGQWLSAESFEYHYGKHHKAYVDKLNELIEGKPEQKMTLEKIVETSSAKLFKNAAQAYNHTFFWHCLTPEKSDLKKFSAVSDALSDSFNGLDNFKKTFKQNAVDQFGSGWSWLVKKANGKIELYSTANAEDPLPKGDIPLLTCDVWEHAYYIDHRNDRAKFVGGFFEHINWQFVADNLKQKDAPNMTQYMK